MPTTLRRQSFFQRWLLLTDSSYTLTQTSYSQTLCAFKHVSEPKLALPSTFAFPHLGRSLVRSPWCASTHGRHLSFTRLQAPLCLLPATEPAHGDAHLSGFQRSAAANKAAKRTPVPLPHTATGPMWNFQRKAAGLVRWCINSQRVLPNRSLKRLYSYIAALSHARSSVFHQRGLPYPEVILKYFSPIFPVFYSLTIIF